MEISLGQAVELIGVENAGLDITGKQGTVTELPAHGLVSVTIDGSHDVVSVWPENLKILRSSDRAPTSTQVDVTEVSGSEPASK